MTGAEQEPDEATGLEELMAGFRRSRGGATARFGAAQAAIIRDLVGQVAELVGGDTLDDGPPDDHPGEPEKGLDDSLARSSALARPSSRPSSGPPGRSPRGLSPGGSSSSASPPTSSATWPTRSRMMTACAAPNRAVAPPPDRRNPAISSSRLVSSSGSGPALVTNRG